MGEARRRQMLGMQPRKDKKDPGIVLEKSIPKLPKAIIRMPKYFELFLASLVGRRDKK